MYASWNEFPRQRRTIFRHDAWQHCGRGTSPSDAFFDSGAETWERFKHGHVGWPVREGEVGGEAVLEGDVVGESPEDVSEC